jgi:hypothetical protein
MALLRWFVLQTVLAAALIAMWLSGKADMFLTDGSIWYVGGVLILAGTGLLFSVRGRINDAANIQFMLPVIAVIAMQLGVVAALSDMSDGLGAGDPMKSVGLFFAAMGTALHVSIAALCGYLWLRTTLWLVNGD